MEANFTEEQRYILAKKRVEKESKFFKHLAIYIIVNLFLSTIFIVGDVNDGVAFYDALTDYHNYKIWIFWGIGILFQFLNVFGIRLFFNKDWEEKKIRKYMNE